MASKTFKRSDRHKKVRLAPGWRKPKGLQNKKRLQLKNQGLNVSSGYRSANSARYKYKDLEIVTVLTTESLKTIDKKTQAALIGKTGKKKKLELIAEAEKLGITIVNLNIENYKENAAKFLEDRKKVAKERTKKQEEKAKAEQAEKNTVAKAKKEKEEKNKSETEVSVEEKQKKEKEEKDKILTKATTKK